MDVLSCGSATPQTVIKTYLVLSGTDIFIPADERNTRLLIPPRVFQERIDTLDKGMFLKWINSYFTMKFGKRAYFPWVRYVHIYT